MKAQDLSVALFRSPSGTVPCIYRRTKAYGFGELTRIGTVSNIQLDGAVRFRTNDGEEIWPHVSFVELMETPPAGAK